MSKTSSVRQSATTTFPPVADDELNLFQATIAGYGSNAGLRKAIASGRLPARKKDGKSWVVRRSDLQALDINIAAATIDAVIERTVALAPRLTAEQIARLGSALASLPKGAA